jgi:hypothetical protein
MWVSFQDMINQEPVVQCQPLEPAHQRAPRAQAAPDMEAALESIFTDRQEKAHMDVTRGVVRDEELFGNLRPAASNEFQPVDEFAKYRDGYDDSAEEVVHGMPLEYGQSCTVPLETAEVACDGCKSPMEPILRAVYDRSSSLKALAGAGILFLLGFFTSASLHFFTGYSFARLAVVYSTGILLLFGTVLLTVGAFLFLAREKAYCCPACRRVYPRS